MGGALTHVTCYGVAWDLTEDSQAGAVLACCAMPVCVSLLVSLMQQSLEKYPANQQMGGVQAAIRPPTFVFFVNDPKLFTDEYRRYVETQLRTNVGFPGTPLRLYWRGKSMSLASGRDGKQQPQAGKS